MANEGNVVTLPNHNGSRIRQAGYMSGFGNASVANSLPKPDM